MGDAGYLSGLVLVDTRGTGCYGGSYRCIRATLGISTSDSGGYGCYGAFQRLLLVDTGDTGHFSLAILVNTGTTVTQPSHTGEIRVVPSIRVR